MVDNLLAMVRLQVAGSKTRVTSKAVGSRTMVSFSTEGAVSNCTRGVGLLELAAVEGSSGGEELVTVVRAVESSGETDGSSMGTVGML